MFVGDENGELCLKKSVINDDLGRLSVVGNLSELYLNLSDVEVSTIYTDQHTRTFEIKIGEIVSMPRNKCDSVQENSCSRGLHVAGKDWLKENYFGGSGYDGSCKPC